MQFCLRRQASTLFIVATLTLSTILGCAEKTGNCDARFYKAENGKCLRLRGPIVEVFLDSTFIHITNGFGRAAVQQSLTTLQAPHKKLKFNFISETPKLGRARSRIVIRAMTTAEQNNNRNVQARTWFEVEESEYVRTATIALNPNFEYSMTVDSSRFHLPSLMLHELGHTLGMAHNSDTTSFMHPVQDPTDVRTVMLEDWREISKVYRLKYLPIGDP